MKSSEKSISPSTFDKSDSQALKGVAILFMMLHHCYYSTDRFAKYDIDFFPLGMERTMDIAMFFKTCVALFAFVSGYGIMISMKKKADSPAALRKSIAGRYLSLMSGYWFVFILCCIAVAILRPSLFRVYNTRHNIAATIVNVILDALGISFLFDAPTLIPTWWYMSFALVLIAVIPIFIKIYKRYGAVSVLVITVFLRYAFERHNQEITRYFMIMVLGIICADRNYLGRAKDKKLVKFGPVDYTLKAILLTVGLYLMYYVRVKDRISGYNTEVRDGIVPLFIVFFCYLVIFPIKPVKVVLEFLGKYSMNIFLTHTFLRVYFLNDFIYSFKNAYLIVLVLTVVSLAVAIVISLLEKLCRIDKLTEAVMKKIFSRIDAAFAPSAPSQPAAAVCSAGVVPAPEITEQPQEETSAAEEK